MGYYTHYSLTLEEGPSGQYAEMLRDIDVILGCDDLSRYEAVYDKWYGYEEDMERLSRKYPDITVRVNGDGEDSDDLWQSFWRNGRQFTERVSFAAYEDIREKLLN